MKRNELIYADQIIHSLYGSLTKAESINNVPGLLERTIDENLWQKRHEQIRNEIVEFNTFEEFVTTPPPRGLGTSIKALKRLCIDEEGKTIVRLIEKIDGLVRKPRGNPTGANQYSKGEEDGGNHDNIMNSKSPQGTDQGYIMDRLKREGKEELVEKVRNNEVTPHKAAIQAGFIKKRISCYNTPEGVVSMVLRHFEEDEIREIIGALSVGR